MKHQSFGVFSITVEVVDEIPEGTPKIDIPGINMKLLVTGYFVGHEIFRFALV